MKPTYEELEAKLAELEGQEPVAWMEWMEWVGGSGAWLLAYSHNPDATTKPLYARPIPAEPVNARLLEAQEPVAWYDGNKFYANEESASMGCADMDNLQPLYTRPIPAEPINARLLEFAQEWLARQGTDENYMTAKARAIIAAAEAQGVTGPKRLTDEEINQIRFDTITELVTMEESELRFARAIETAVLGVQEAKKWGLNKWTTNN